MDFGAWNLEFPGLRLVALARADSNQPLKVISIGCYIQFSINSVSENHNLLVNFHQRVCRYRKQIIYIFIRRTKKIAALIILILSQSCIWIRMDDSIDLGNNYRYIQDYPQTIIYQISQEHIGSGPEAIPPVVMEYAYNDKWIIAINKDLEDQHISYWIIDKSKDYKSIEPLDSIAYTMKIKEKNIDLKLEKN